MARVLRMPGISANATEAVLTAWLVEESGDFAAADVIASVETDKALVDVEAEVAGRLLKTLVPAGARVEVGDPIALLGSVGEEVDDLDTLLGSLGVTNSASTAASDRGEVNPGPELVAPAPDEAPASIRIFSSPLARKIALDAGLSIDQITGSGPGGRILRRDVEQAKSRVVDEPAPASISRPAASGPYEDVPHSRVRRATASRLVESKQAVPHFYLRSTIRAERLLEARAQINDGSAAKVSLNDLVIKAVAAAHHRVPELNVTWMSDAARHYSSVDIAVAIATDRGLLTPVVRDVGALTVTAVAAQVRELAGRARDRTLKQEELEGGSISVTNLGMYDVEEFAAIINPPQAAILAVGAVRDAPVVEGGVVVPGRVVTVTLSVDHRPVDGVVAAQWMAALVDVVEHPMRLLA